MVGTRTAKKHVNDRQLAITTLYLSEFVLKRLESISEGSNTTPSEIANQILTEVLTPYED